MMKLVGFQVTNFRSVEDSGWIDTDMVTSLIGTNESGKTNLLVPLWKLNPAKDGEINPITDYPRKRYNEIRSMEDKPIFITAQFELGDDLAEEIADLTGSTADEVRIANVSRDLGSKYRIVFPKAKPIRNISRDVLSKLLSDARTDINDQLAAKTEEHIKAQILVVLDSASREVTKSPQQVNAASLRSWLTTLKGVDTSDAPKRSTIAPRFARTIEAVNEVYEQITKPHPQEIKEARTLVLKNLPSFVYYSNYGNLDSEIYLPHVIVNMKRQDLGTKEEAKVRTLKVLFEFVKLKPEEIRELGRDHHESQGTITEEKISEIAKKKTERDILLQSASTELTHKFREWWKQGDYRFRFQADGDHFRIWVSDDKRPEDVELESRSTGLQWFLSFYLIFLVESQDSHEGAILLLDEPGHSLHPIAQRDLSEFFDNLATTNQLLYTTHSPFLVDPDRLDRVKAVYTHQNGTTKVSSDLRVGEGSAAQTHSIYPVHAALGLSVSDTLLQGCLSVIVEGPSDQHYLSGIKNYLIGEKIINPKREIVFLPAGGVRGVRAIASIVTGKDEALPHVILDSDKQGQQLATNLKSELYNSDPERILMLEDIRRLPGAEVEDLFPTEFLADVISRYLRRIAPVGTEDDFADGVKENQSIVPQVEAYAALNNVELQKPGWKVEVAKLVKARLLKRNTMPAEFLEIWKEVFTKLQT